MNHPQLREVLERLSRGEITPEQADRDLAGLGAGAATGDEPRGPAAVSIGEPVSAEEPTPRSAITVRATMNGSGPLTVVGEAISVPEVRGPASATIDGDGAAFVISSSYADGTELAVPAAADLILEVNGSEVELRNLTGTLDGTFNVGDVIVGARLASGESRIRANAGPLVVTLAAGSDVRVLLRTGCQWTVDPRITAAGPGEWIVGEGRASLKIEGNLGHFDLVGPVGE
jgi:hypothetical protein